MIRRIIIGGLLITASILGVVLFNSQSNIEDCKLSNEDFIHAITTKYPTFLNKNEPVIKIASVSKYDGGWYVVIISSVREVKEFVPVKLVFLESESSINIILGPETHFTEIEMLSHNLPDSVIMDLQKS